MFITKGEMISVIQKSILMKSICQKNDLFKRKELDYSTGVMIISCYPTVNVICIGRKVYHYDYLRYMVIKLSSTI
jgi:hypothetical protein